MKTLIHLHKVPAPLLRAVLQSTLQQLHKLQQSAPPQSRTNHLRRPPVPVARMVLQNILYQVRQVPVPLLRAVLQSTLHPVRQLPPRARLYQYFWMWRNLR